MMKFFKYLIFLFLTLFSINTFAVTKYSTTNNIVDAIYSKIEDACKAAVPNYTTVLSVSGNRCTMYWPSADRDTIVTVYAHDLSCEVGQRSNISLYVDSPMPSTVCLSQCEYKRPTDEGVGCVDIDNPNNIPELGGQNVESCGPVISTGQTCSTPPPPNNIYGTPPTNQPASCKNASGSDAYCDKPPTGCPSGYKEGMFNNKQICVKNSPDPDPNKPNPNDPNNGNGNGEGNCNGTNNCNTSNFDDSGIISAINSMKSSLSSAISSLSSAISSMSSSLSSAINGTTAAVNANGDKVTNAVNTNGKNTVDALNKGTEATKENGKKLDGINNGVKEGNGLLKDIKDFFTGDAAAPDSPDVVISDHVLPEEKTYVSWSASCPPDYNVPINLMGQSSTLKLSWSPICDLLSKIRWAILALSYFGAAYIILGMRS